MNNRDLLQDISKWRTNNGCLFKRKQCPTFILQEQNANKSSSKMVGCCPSTGFSVRFCRNVLLFVLLYSKDIIPEELFPLYSAVTCWHLDSQVLISTTDFPLGVNINDGSTKKALLHLTELRPLIRDNLTGSLMFPSSRKCRTLRIRMAPSSWIFPSPWQELPKLPHLWQFQAWSATACGQLYQNVLKDAMRPD